VHRPIYSCVVPVKGKRQFFDQAQPSLQGKAFATSFNENQA